MTSTEIVIRRAGFMGPVGAGTLNSGPAPMRASSGLNVSSALADQAKATKAMVKDFPLLLGRLGRTFGLAMTKGVGAALQFSGLITAVLAIGTILSTGFEPLIKVFGAILKILGAFLIPFAIVGIRVLVPIMVILTRLLKIWMDFTGAGKNIPLQPFDTDAASNSLTALLNLLGDPASAERVKKANEESKKFWDGVFKFFTDNPNPFAAVANWLKKFQTPEGDIDFNAMFIRLKDKLKAIGTGAAEWIQTNVVDKIGTWFTAITFGVMGIAGNIAYWFLNNLSGGKLDSLLKGAKDAVDQFASGLGSAIETVGNALINFVNGILHWLREKANIFGAGFLIPPDIPQLAKGGIVTKPTLALIGEAGPEAVVPLSGGGGGAGMTINITVQGSLFGDLDKFAQDLARYTKFELSQRGRFTGATYSAGV